MLDDSIAHINNVCAWTKYSRIKFWKIILDMVFLPIFLLNLNSLRALQKRKKKGNLFFCWINDKLTNVFYPLHAIPVTLNSFKYGFNGIIEMLLNNQYAPANPVLSSIMDCIGSFHVSYTQMRLTQSFV